VTHLRSEQLLAAPELGVLEVLETAIDVAILALLAAHPELRDDADVITLPAAEAALDVVDTAHALGALVNRYRLALTLSDNDSSDLPF